MTGREKALRSMKKSDLVAYILGLERIGAQMSNMCFNLAQQREFKITSPHERDVLQELRKEWDEQRLSISSFRSAND